MANNAYICRIRTDLGSGAFQVLDLYPNASQRSLIYEPNPQTGYLPFRIENDAVTGSTGAGVTTKILKGLAAYLADTVEDNGGDGITEAEADAAAASIIARLDAGSSLTSTEVDTILTADCTAVLATSGFSTLADILKICGGGKYSVPAGTAVDGTGAFKATADGSFDDAGYLQFFSTGSLQISCGEGTLAAFSKPNFYYNETTGAALVVYDESGNVLT
jgi:hypothetical protein